MEKILLEKALFVVDAIEKSEEVRALKNIEKDIENNTEIVAILEEYSQLQKKLEKDLEEKTIEDISLRPLRHKLSEVKYILDTNELIIKYNKAYKVVNAMYKKINNQIFDQFHGLKECKCN